jgi:hypothetical protein
MFMSWNGFPRAIRNLLISKLKNKFSTDRPRTNIFDKNDNRPKVWVRVPYLGKQGETLVKNCIQKIQRCPTVPVNFIVIYDNKKFSYFLSNKDKIPNLSKSNVVYEVTCPSLLRSLFAGPRRLDMSWLFHTVPQRIFGKQKDVYRRGSLHEHTNPTKSAIGNIFTTANMTHVQYIVNLHFVLTNLTQLTLTITFPLLFPTSLLTTLKFFTLLILAHLIFSCCLKLYISSTMHSPSLNTGLKASKELKLFP